MYDMREKDLQPKNALVPVSQVSLTDLPSPPTEATTAVTKVPWHDLCVGPSCMVAVTDQEAVGGSENESARVMHKREKEQQPLSRSMKIKSLSA